MKRLFNLFFVLALGVSMVSCYPGGAEYTSDTDLVITNYNPEFNFGTVKHYYMADSISHIVPEGQDPNYELDPFVIGEMERNFEALGWVRVDSLFEGKPDLAVTLSIIKVQNYNIYTIPWYPGWGWGWYWKSSDDVNYWGYPGYGWGYPWYGGTYVTSYETGTVVWYTFDPDNVDEDNEVIYLDWQGAVNGVVGSSTSTTKDRVSKGIDQGFRQSPYLSGE